MLYTFSKCLVPQETIFELRENLNRAGKGTGLLKEEKGMNTTQVEFVA